MVGSLISSHTYLKSGSRFRASLLIFTYFYLICLFFLKNGFIISFDSMLPSDLVCFHLITADGFPSRMHMYPGPDRSCCCHSVLVPPELQISAVLSDGNNLEFHPLRSFYQDFRFRFIGLFSGASRPRYPFPSGTFLSPSFSKTVI